MSLVLTNAGEKLEIAATAVVPFTVHYADYVGATPAFTPGVGSGDTINGTKDLLAAPGSGQRVVRTISVHNDSGGSDDITIQLDAAGTNYTIITVTLPDGYTLCYDEDGWKVLDSNGSLVTVVSPHALLGPYHIGTETNAPSRGSVMVANALDDWDELIHPGPSYHLYTDTNDTLWGVNVPMINNAWIGIANDLRVKFNLTDGHLELRLGDALGSDEVRVIDNANNPVFRIDSDGNVTATSGETHLKALITTSGGELTIDAAGAITVTHSSHYVDTFGDAATDDLITINGGADGQILILRSTSSARDTTLKEGGNLWLAGDFTLDSVADRIVLLKTGASWYEISRADNN